MLSVTIRTDLCAQMGVSLCDITVRSQPGSGLYITGHILARQDYRSKPGCVLQLFADVLDEDDRVLRIAEGEYFGVFEENSFAPFRVFIPGGWLNRAEQVSLYLLHQREG